MADRNPELQEKLDELERELEEGDITAKGYQKRRTQLFSQYIGPGAFVPPEARGPLRIHSPDDTSQSGSDGHRAATLAALNASSSDKNPQSPTSIHSPKTGRPQSPPFGSPPDHAHPASLLAPGGSFADQRPVIRPHDSLFLGPAPNQGSTAEPSRTGTMVSTDYAFNPEHQSGYGDSQYRQYDGQSRSGTLLDSQGFFFGLCWPTIL